MLKIKVNKKGIFFTFAAIVLSIVIILSFNVYNDYRLSDEMDVVEIRINTMGNFVKDMENDLRNAIFIVGYRSLLSLEDYMMDHGKFFNVDETPTLAAAFDEVFRLGTIDYDGSSEKMGMMDDNIFFNWTERMKAAANKTDIVVDFTINSVTISHSEPWKVDVTVNMDIDIRDKKNTASWIINSKDYTGQINITGFVDPLYLVKTQGKANNTIRKTTVPDFDDEDDLEIHLLNSYYIEHSDAPSYVMRFENDLSSSAYGIESLVNSQELENNGATTYSRSAVDYIYFGSGGTDCEVKKPSYSWFRLDDNHIDFYGARCN